MVSTRAQARAQQQQPQRKRRRSSSRSSNASYRPNGGVVQEWSEGESELDEIAEWSDYSSSRSPVKSARATPRVLTRHREVGTVRLLLLTVVLRKVPVWPRRRAARQGAQEEAQAGAEEAQGRGCHIGGGGGALKGGLARGGLMPFSLLTSVRAVCHLVSLGKCRQRSS